MVLHKVAVMAEILRRGEGEQDQPWFDFKVEKGYSEQFPTGIIERTTSARFEFDILV